MLRDICLGRTKQELASMKVQGHFGFTNPLILAAALFSFPALGAEAPPANTVEPRADEILQRMSDCLAKAKFFSVKAEIWQDIDLSSGQRVQADRRKGL